METGLALAGGGIPGCAAVGVIKAFEEEGITITHITGTSSGAMVAALYAYGYRGAELASIIPQLSRRYLDIDWKSLLLRALFLQPSFEGWLKGSRLRTLIASLTKNEDISSIHLPCGIVASDLNTGTKVVFTQSKGIENSITENVTIADAVRASFAIPVVFQPLRLSDKILIDGGVQENCPVSLCKRLGAKHVVAVDPISPIADIPLPALGTYKLLHKIVYMNLKQQMQTELNRADYLLQPETGFIGAFQFRKAAHCMEAGYQAAKGQLPRIKEMLA
ncbi:patatin-like phospholipase family protein [Peribacillus kribbensis]|uniref:patatin-like phospholipase family protein n=1 Tax=Peribacillus kribbensis TaxID=356658 RepID=UPI0003FF73D3|nr:patatin-like phospholipase family protein [Peribacillus kribbensis]